MHWKSKNTSKCWDGWTTVATSTSSLVLQDLVEKVIMLIKVVERERRQFCGLQTKPVQWKRSIVAEQVIKQRV
ncbi:hypothetical protein EMCRGX_G008762 [Ephydatia muelleri]